MQKAAFVRVQTRGTKAVVKFIPRRGVAKARENSSILHILPPWPVPAPAREQTNSLSRFSRKFARQKIQTVSAQINETA